MHRLQDLTVFAFVWVFFLVFTKCDVHFSCSANRVEAHESLWLASLYLLGTDRLSETSYTQTPSTTARSHTHKQFCMAVLLGLFTLSRRPSVRQWNEWLFILEGWFNELDPQLLCVSTRNTETRPSPFLTPYTRQGAGTPWLHPVGRVTQGARRRPSKGSLLIYKRHLAEAVHGPFSCSTSPFLLSSPITSPPW